MQHFQPEIDSSQTVGAWDAVSRADTSSKNKYDRRSAFFQIRALICGCRNILGPSQHGALQYVGWVWETENNYLSQSIP